ncbi:SP0191 family lipoprotein [Streptococcus oricebi]|uniref:SP-0191-like C-terminal domain-containing protein n=1 Tax=Streptococcus oricebi TaxID=1547447 RepID=A0ABS5B537_9STRE|nr:SP0191 family lipoprotein [Streptococcus oricebi]MBP2623935.1 hypothetical protein [Streptococcus oricebi]
MKKILPLALALVLLGACGPKKETKTDDNKETLPSSLPILSQSDSSKESKRVKLAFPKGEGTSQQSQIIDYQGDQFLALTMEDLSPLTAELQEAVQQFGAEETQKMLNESFAQDEANKALRDLAGFSLTYEIVDNQLKRSSHYDFKKLNLEQAEAIPVLKSAGLKELVKLKPTDYIERQKQNGAIEVAD